MTTLSRSLTKSAVCAGMLAVSLLGSPFASADAIRPNAGFTTNHAFVGSLDPATGKNDDLSTSLIQLPFELCFFGQHFSALYVNNNGNVTFGAPLSTFTPNFGLLNLPIIAPFFADVDTRNEASGFTTYGNDTVDGHLAFGVDWLDVGYYQQRANKLDSFQLVLIDRSDIAAQDFDIEFNYRTITWETGDVSGGSNGLGGNSALVGYGNGAGTSFAYPGSLVNGAFLDGGPLALRDTVQNSEGVVGRIVIQCRNCGVINGTVPEPGTLALVGLALSGLALRRRRSQS